MLPYNISVMFRIQMLMNVLLTQVFAPISVKTCSLHSGVLVRWVTCFLQTTGLVKVRHFFGL